jgi:predicted transcriptional regulator
LDSHWIKESFEGKAPRSMSIGFTNENIVKDKVQMYLSSPEPRIFSKTFAQQVDLSKRDSLSEKVEKLKQIGFSDEHLSLYFLLKRNEDVESTALDLKKIQAK